MNLLTFIRSAISNTRRLLTRALRAATDAGLTDDVIALALPYIKEASSKYIETSARREWVVAQLVSRGVPEGISRIAVELGYRLYKAELAKLGV